MDSVTIFTDPKAYADPERWHAVAARLRREEPVARIEVEPFDPFWAVTRHADVIEIERQPGRFPNTPESVLMPKAMKPSRGGPPMPVKTLINMDGEEHRAYRSLTNDWFKPAALKKTLRPRIEQLARKYVDRMAELGGACDFAMDVARYYPLQVMMSVLGVPESDELRMLDLTQKTFGARALSGLEGTLRVLRHASGAGCGTRSVGSTVDAGRRDAGRRHCSRRPQFRRHGVVLRRRLLQRARRAARWDESLRPPPAQPQSIARVLGRARYGRIVRSARRLVPLAAGILRARGGGDARSARLGSRGLASVHAGLRVHFAASFYQCRRDVETARALADEGVLHSTEHEFELLASMRAVHRGWLLVDAVEIRDGVTAYRGTGSGFGVPTFLGLLAETYEKLDQHDAGLAAVADALAFSEASGAHYWDAELERLQGALVLRRGSASAEGDAESCFRRSIEIAKRQRAKSFELRTATSLGRLWQSQGRIDEARGLLSEVHEWFHEGFETADLTDAKALLGQLGGATKRTG